jgi:hypothetical protein
MVSAAGHAAARPAGAVQISGVTIPAAGRGAHLLAKRPPGIWLDGRPVLVVWDGQGRPYWQCPCGRRCKHIYLDELRCRICLHLDYSSRHLYRTVPGLHRIVKLLTVLGGIAEFERDLILQRTNEGRARAMAEGTRFGRRPKLTKHQAREALKRVAAGEPLREIALSYAVDHSTISRLKARHAVEA